MNATRPPWKWWAERAKTFRLRFRSGQLEGPCPACGGTDRFHVSKTPDGLFGCRKCRGFLAILRAADWEGVKTAFPAKYSIAHPPQPPLTARPRDAHESHAKTPPSKPKPDGPVISQQSWSFPLAKGGFVKLYRDNYANGAKIIKRTPAKDYGIERPYLPLPGFDPGRSVLIVEGPKCVDAARAHGMNATCWFAALANHKRTDWSALAGQAVWLWPDNDEPGAQCMAELAGHLVETHQCTVLMIDTGGLAHAQDCADVDSATAKRMILQARMNGATAATAR